MLYLTEATAMLSIAIVINFLIYVGLSRASFKDASNKYSHAMIREHRQLVVCSCWNKVKGPGILFIFNSSGHAGKMLQKI